MQNKHLILVVNINKKNAEILSDFLGRYGFESIVATSIEELEGAINDNSEISLALVDITGFGKEIWDRMKGLQDKDIPFLIIYPKQIKSIKLETEGIKAGAKAVLSKPLSSEYLIRFIKEMLS
ncbi:MAG: hypothetical protein D6778_04965 [Nitrospirae bacterium]|nr:MAG: hypothetical protein D6778_04965 [Nitrospirota bacterium]